MVFPELPAVAPDQEALARALEDLSPSQGLRAALLAPLDGLQARLTDPQRLALAQVRGAFPPVGPFSYVPLGVFLWQWAAYGAVVAPGHRLLDSVNDAIASGGESYAASPLFKALILAAEGSMARFWGVFGQWGSLFLNHGTITTLSAQEGDAALLFSGHAPTASSFYVPGLLRGWMRCFGARGGASLEARGDAEFVARLRWT